MRAHKRFPFTAPARLALALMLTLTSTAGVSGQGRTPPGATDRVTLEDSVGDAGACPAGRATERVLPDGTKVPFVVPQGRVLVLTDMQGVVSQQFPALWSANHVGRVVTLRARGPLNNLQWFDATTPLTTDAVAAGVAPVEAHLVSGAVFGPGSILCIAAFIATSSGSFTAQGRARLQGVLLDE